MIVLLLPLLLLDTPAPACVVVEGDTVTLADLAKAVPSLAAVDAATAAGYSPQPGEQRVFRPEQISALLRRQGGPSYEGPGICVERASQTLTPESLLPVLLAAFPAGTVRIELLDFTRSALPPGRLDFPLPGLSRPGPAGKTDLLWRGRVVFGQHRSRAIWARVTIVGPVKRFIAVNALAQGEAIGDQDVRQETIEGPVTEAEPEPLPVSVAGMIPRAAIAAGAEVPLAMLEAKKEIRRGDPVTVELQSEGVSLRLQATAETGGARGERVLVRSLLSNKLLPVIVAGPGHAVLRGPVPGAPMKRIPPSRPSGVRHD
jgi:flagella basal body P-ring formation protein FlgA